MAVEYSEMSDDELHEQLDNIIATLEGRTSKFKRQTKPLVSAMRECYKKIQYETLRTAHKRAARYTEQFGVTQRVYECTVCGLWHITPQAETLDKILALITQELKEAERVAVLKALRKADRHIIYVWGENRDAGYFKAEIKHLKRKEDDE